MSQSLQNGRISPQAQFGYLPGLDGVRALAVLLVLVAHVGFDHVVPGGFGVTVFFFVSGFLITRLLIAEQEKAGAVALGRFYVRRFLRLLPALYIMLIVTAAIMIAMGDIPRLWEVIAAFTYTMNYQHALLSFTGGSQVAPWEHLWSLAVEEHFYLLFPLLLGVFRGRLKGALVACLMICAAALSWRLVTLHLLDFPPTYNYLASETRMDSIVWGCTLSLALHLYPRAALWRWLVGPLALGLAVMALLLCFGLRDEAFRQSFRYSIQGAALFVGMANLYFWRPLGPLVAVLEWPLLAWIGRISYGLYLWHMPVLLFTSDYLGFAEGSAGYILVGVALSFVSCAISYYYAERPLMDLRRRFGSHVTTGPKRVTVSTEAEQGA